MKSETTHQCSIHEGEKYTYFCKACETLTCKDCTLQHHHKHDYCQIHDIVKDFKHSLTEMLGIFREHKEEIGYKIKQFQKCESDLKVRNEKTQLEINQHFDNLAKTLETQRKRLLSKAEKITESKLISIGNKIEELRLKQGCLISTIDDITEHFDELKDEEIVMIEKRISEDIKSLPASINEYEQPNPSGNDLTFLNVSAESFKKSLSELCFVTTSYVSPNNCTSSLEPSKLKKGEQAVLTVTCKDKMDDVIKYGGQRIKVEFSGNACTVREAGDIIDHHNGTHDINFVPTSQGKLIIKVYINCEIAPKCSFEGTVGRDSIIFR